MQLVCLGEPFMIFAVLKLPARTVVPEKLNHRAGSYDKGKGSLPAAEQTGEPSPHPGSVPEHRGQACRPSCLRTAAPADAAKMLLQTSKTRSLAWRFAPELPPCWLSSFPSFLQWTASPTASMDWTLRLPRRAPGVCRDWLAHKAASERTGLGKDAAGKAVPFAESVGDEDQLRLFSPPLLRTP